jgi:hypothetical protein
MSHSGVPGASLLSSNPNYNPLGTVGPLLPDIAAAAGEIVAPGNPFSTAAFLTKGGFDLSQGSILPGLLQFAGAGAPFLLGGAGGGAAAAGGNAGTGAATTGATAAGGFGASLSDFLSNPSLAGLGNIGSAAGADISSGYSSLLNSIGLGTPATATQGINPLATGGGAVAGGAAPGSGAPFDLTASAGATPAANAVALGGAPAGTVAGGVPGLVTTGGGATGGTGTAASGGGLLNTISNFTSAHPYLTLGGGLIGSQLLSPELSKITGSGTTSQENALLGNAQGAINTENQLIGDEASGNLPPGAQASVSNALQSDIAQIKARYASLGMSGSSAEQQDIANAQQQAAGQQFTLASNATQTGLSALGLTTNVYDTLVQDQLTRQQALQNAFSGFFDALGTGTALGQAKNLATAA